MLLTFVREGDQFNAISGAFWAMGKWYLMLSVSRTGWLEILAEYYLP